jgi:hypothetical protein
MSVKLGIVKAADRLLNIDITEMFNYGGFKKIEYETYMLEIKMTKEEYKKLIRQSNYFMKNFVAER